MKMQRLFINLLVFLFIKADAQKIHYTVANAHSHNDYENKFPFVTAYKEKFGSMEADIFLWNDSLIVGHTLFDIHYKRTLEQLYLDPLQKNTAGNNGYPYKDSTLSLQLLIDIKTSATATLNKLVQVLNKYPVLINSKKIHFVITGNRPPETAFLSYPSFILFDGDLRINYTEKALKKIVMLSDDLKNYTHWEGKGTIPEGDKAVLDSLVEKVHRLKKKIRFWDAPDSPDAWYQLINTKVDYLNTDHIQQLSAFLSRLNSK